MSGRSILNEKEGRYMSLEIVRVVLLLLVAAAIAGLVFIAKGIVKISRRQILQGISYVTVGGLILFLSFVFTIFGVNFGSPRKDAMRKATRGSIANITLGLDTFQTDTGRYPTEKEGLDILINNSGLGNWKGPYMRTNEVPKDSWGTPFRYTLTNGVPLVISAGPDMKLGTSDDIQSYSP